MQLNFSVYGKYSCFLRHLLMSTVFTRRHELVFRWSAAFIGQSPSKERNERDADCTAMAFLCFYTVTEKFIFLFIYIFGTLNPAYANYITALLRSYITEYCSSLLYFIFYMNNSLLNFKLFLLWRGICACDTGRFYRGILLFDYLFKGRIRYSYCRANLMSTVRLPMWTFELLPNEYAVLLF